MRGRVFPGSVFVKLIPAIDFFLVTACSGRGASPSIVLRPLSSARPRAACLPDCVGGGGGCVMSVCALWRRVASCGACASLRIGIIRYVFCIVYCGDLYSMSSIILSSVWLLP